MRKMYIVPNMLTTANLFCGFYSSILSSRNDFKEAAYFILIAGIFDALDGRIARLAKATSAFGVEFDSLSDLISFGFAPSFLLYYSNLLDTDRLGVVVCFFYVACAAFRLARFNVGTSGTNPKQFFQGVASPVAAGFIATFALFSIETQWPTPQSWIDATTICAAQALVLGTLMVSNIPFPSFKEIHWRSRSSFKYLWIGFLIIVLVAIDPVRHLFVVNSLYLLLSLVWNLYRWTRRKLRDPVH